MCRRCETGATDRIAEQVSKAATFGVTFRPRRMPSFKWEDAIEADIVLDLGGGYIEQISDRLEDLSGFDSSRCALFWIPTAGTFLLPERVPASQ